MASQVVIAARPKFYEDAESNFKADCDLLISYETNKTWIGKVSPQQKEQLYQEICKTHAKMRDMLQQEGLNERAIDRACSLADEQLEGVRQLYKPLDSVETRVAQLRERMLPRARASERVLQERGRPADYTLKDHQLKQWVDSFGLLVLKEDFARGRTIASLNMNAFIDTQRRAILEMVQTAHPEWRVSITMWENMAFLTAEKQI